MKHFSKAIQSKGGETIFSFALQLTKEEVLGIESITDNPHVSPGGVVKNFNEDPEVGVVFIRQLIWLADIWNTRKDPGSQMVIKSMSDRKAKNEPTRRRPKRKTKTRVRRRLQKRS